MFVDANHNGIKDKEDTVLSNVEIRVYREKEERRKNAHGGEDTRILRQELVGQVRTDEKGEYKLTVREEGKYCLVLDINSLPKGLGVQFPRIYIREKSSNENHFAVKKVVSIDLGTQYEKNMFEEGEPFIHPVLKDDHGMQLIGNVDYSLEEKEPGQRGNGWILDPKETNRHQQILHIASGLVTAQSSVKLKVPEEDALYMADAAFDKGLIDEKTKMEQYMKILFDPSSISRGNTSQKAIKSGTTAMKELLDYIQKKDAERDIVSQAEEYIRLSVPNLDQVYTSPGKRFRIHYTLRGEHAVSAGKGDKDGVPDYIQAVGNSFEEVMSITCDHRGFRKPLFEKGRSSLDVYVYNLKGTYGVTVPTSFQGIKGKEPRKSPCYICIDNNYSKEKGFDKEKNDCMKVTAAHEFFHAVQYAYNVDADIWWKEASATWNEDEVYNGVNDYIRYVAGMLSKPGKSLDKSSYGGVIFAKYLSEYYGGYRIIKQVWEVQERYQRNSIHAIDQVLQQKSSNLDIGKAFSQFAAFNYNPAQYYTEGGLWEAKVAVKNTYTHYPAVSQEMKLDHLASSYELFKAPESGNANLRISVEGDAKKKWGLRLQKRRHSDGLYDMTDVSLKRGEHRIEMVVMDFGNTYSEVCLIPVNLEKKSDGATFQYSADREE